MRAFVDCEWDNAADGGHGRTISIGVCIPEAPESRRYFHLWDPEAWRTARSRWVRENVKDYDHSSMNLYGVGFFSLTPQSVAIALGRATEVIVDWPEDVARVCAALVIPGAPPSMAPVSPVLRFTVDRRLSSADSVCPHNALADAIAIAQSWEQFQ